MSRGQFNSLSELVEIEQEKLEKLYEIARIDSLSHTKEEVVRWVGMWAAVLAVASSILAAFGINQLIDNRVTSRVTSELDRLQTSVQDTQVEIGVALEESRSNLNQIETSLSQASKFEE